jgi:hypothetical protein
MLNLPLDQGRSLLCSVSEGVNDLKPIPSSNVPDLLSYYVHAFPPNLTGILSPRLFCHSLSEP